MRIYLAAPWVCKAEALAAATTLEVAGHTITKKWWEHREVNGYLRDDISTEQREELMIQAMEDIAGVWNAQAFILLNGKVSEGKSVETGLALAYSTPIVLIGAPSNLFHYLPHVFRVDTIEDAIALLPTLR